jgi:acyl-CoA synthetase (NDP forming)
MSAAHDLSPFFVPRSIAVVGAGEGAISSGGAIMQMLRQAGYGGRVVPVNPKGGTIFRLRDSDLDRRHRSATSASAGRAHAECCPA